MTSRIPVSTFVIGAVLFIGVLLWAYVSGLHTNVSVGSAPMGLAATVGSSSVYALAASTAASIVATSSCTARIITTSGATGGMMLTFGDYAAQTPTATFGHYQAASTTVAYDGGIYGCGLVKAFSFAAQTITVSDVR